MGVKLKPKISIIVPCYKVEKYLPRCLDSLMAQTLNEIEVICINDGSPDRCIDILKNYKREYRERIVIIDKENEGVWRGRRDAIRIAQGDYIGFVDSDDYVAPNFCEELYSAALRDDADISVCGFYRVDSESGKVLTEELTDYREPFSAKDNPMLLLQLNGAPWNKLFRAPLLKEMKDFLNPPKIFDDMMMHMLVYPDVENVTFVGKPLVYYGIRGDSIMTTISTGQLDSTYACMLEVKKYYEDRSVDRQMQEFIDLAAVLHLGVSLMFRMSCDPTSDMHSILLNNRRYLDDNFPSWGISKIPVDNKAMRKISLSRMIYKSSLFEPALKLYCLLIERFGIDIKW